MVKPVWNNAQRVNHQNFAKKTHPCTKKNLVPRVVLMKSGLVSINTARQNISKTTVLFNTARQVNTAHSKTTVNAARPMSYLSKIAHSTVKIPIHKNTAFKNNNINQRGKNLNTARPKAVVNDVKGNNDNVVKASTCWVWKPKTKVLDHVNPQIDLQDQGVINSGCSRHMTGNMSYLTDYEEIDGGYVAFGGNLKGGKITRKARTPQQNGVVERRNRTLIEVARTMLADSKLPTTFWAEAVNTACYVQNRVLVVKPHNKTPYELFHGRTPTLSFMRPFGCPVTILNTIDHLGKFDGKADEDPKSSHDDGSKPSSDDGKKVDEDPRKESECNDQEKEDNVNNTNNVNVAGTNEVNAVGGKTSIELPYDPNMPALEDDSIFDFTRDDEDDGIVADMNNLDSYNLNEFYGKDLHLFLGLHVQQNKFIEVKNASTLMETQNPRLKDENGEEVDVYMYRSMIGSLMYLTSSRPDIMFVVCACARYQVNPKVSHLHAVKRIFRYLKGQPKLGLWYPKDSSFDLVAYTDSDYAGASLDRKSITRCCQFLGCRLISWQCKKQTVVANSTIEAEYVAA
ncbi:uncharacterized mitochondrial protein-like protein [Tanacetum coccineum]|uniref:Uncharacterized mitochondrial protein-like protein n=1 Tax=Tanacetum coccineum TaxID=301880 RepID=A0ABQ5CM74_9ASTR